MQDNWNDFAVLPIGLQATVRARIRSGILDKIVDKALVPLSIVQNHLPMHTRNFSDFYCSLEHAKNVCHFRRWNISVFFLLWLANAFKCTEVMKLKVSSNWFSIPSVYNGRTSSLAVSGTPITRPCGMYPDPQTGAISFQPESKLDFELEIGVWLSTPVLRGQRLDIAKAKEHIFGFTLLNDWSSRQIQSFEMPPLGCFHSKGSLTSVSPWIVPIEVLESVKCGRTTQQDPLPVAHLMPQDDAALTYDIDLSVTLLRDEKSYTLCESNLNTLYWTPIQQLTHLASAGEWLSTGDVFGTGTISTSATNSDGEKIGLGCLLERSLPRTVLKSAPPDLHETFLKDGDEVILEGWCRNKTTGQVVFGFGQCRGKVLPAIP
ncbi:Fumarylacetoacetase [Penicillium subrubescens]|uniref:Fumarylacetoacetase n=1 Tax=Penicillium subrubescens TaxID=1316194 RepID=A0A1Q5UQU3_9EURO|nr:Fumarylacetoacetase [Penicillium subrubescens]